RLALTALATLTAFTARLTLSALGFRRQRHLFHTGLGIGRLQIALLCSFGVAGLALTIAWLALRACIFTWTLIALCAFVALATAVAVFDAVGFAVGAIAAFNTFAAFVTAAIAA